jgi:YfiH family protein
MIELVKPVWSAPAHVQACCTTRYGGISQTPYDSLNLAMHVGDHDADVRQNRKRLVDDLMLPNEPCWINQTHSVDVVTLENEVSRNADAAVTRQPGCIAVVMTADCLPILLCNRNGTEVAAVHAGWRGLQSGVIQSALAAMQSPATQLLAWIGPGITQPNFEVGDEVYAAFVDQDPLSASFFSAKRPGHWLCDLAGIAERVLRNAGVGEVSCSPHCSFRDQELFYSYRRVATSGRMASLIWIN